MTHRVGIMQGRLSPLVDGRIQAFPLNNWKEEYQIAKECCFDSIEWVLDSVMLEQNPLLDIAGRRDISFLQEMYGIDTQSICCDYFIDHPLHSKVPETRIQAQNMLSNLLEVCPTVGIRNIEIPFVEKSALATDADIAYVLALLNDLIPQLEKCNINILLETNLKPLKLVSWVEKIRSSKIQINYDTGNSAYWGYKPDDEIPLYGHRIGNIHIKDCTPEAYSVPLGKGAVNFDLVFQLLREVDYHGDFILQTARDNDNVGVAKIYRQFTIDYIERYLR